MSELDYPAMRRNLDAVHVTLDDPDRLRTVIEYCGWAARFGGLAMDSGNYGDAREKLAYIERIAANALAEPSSSEGAVSPVPPRTTACVETPSGYGYVVHSVTFVKHVRAPDHHADEPCTAPFEDRTIGLCEPGSPVPPEPPGV